MSKPVHNWSLNVYELAHHLSEVMGLSMFHAELLVIAFVEEICEALERGEEVDLGPDFGKFYPIKIPERFAGVNVETGEPLHLPPRVQVNFSPGRRLKERVAESEPTPYYRRSQDGTKA